MSHARLRWSLRLAKVWTTVFATGMILLVALSARAQTGNPQTRRKDARALALEGKRLMDDEQYGAACEKFKQSLALDNDIKTVGNLGNCYEKAGDMISAAATYQQGLDDAKLSTPKLVNEFQERLDRAKANIAMLTIRVAETARPVIGKIELDGKAIAAEHWGIPIAANPGERKLVVTSVVGLPIGEVKTLHIVVDKDNPSYVSVTGESDWPDAVTREAAIREKWKAAAPLRAKGVDGWCEVLRPSSKIFKSLPAFLRGPELAEDFKQCDMIPSMEATLAFAESRRIVAENGLSGGAVPADPGKAAAYQHACTALRYAVSLHSSPRWLIDLSGCDLNMGRTATAYEELVQAKAIAESWGLKDVALQADVQITAVGPTVPRLRIESVAGLDGVEMVCEADASLFLDIPAGGVELLHNSGKCRLRREGYVSAEVDLRDGQTQRVVLKRAPGFGSGPVEHPPTAGPPFSCRCSVPGLDTGRTPRGWAWEPILSIASVLAAWIKRRRRDRAANDSVHTPPAAE